jgi:enamine deaminase RidA (YjgF/YER057c/UK114 family)
MRRQHVTSGTRWEEQVGYSRALRCGSTVYVSGTTATDEFGNVVGVGNAYAQAFYILEKIERSLNEAGASMREVVRTRMYVVNVEDWEAVGRAHAAFFKDIRPASTLVEVSRLIGPDYLVEIEVEAVIDSYA